jgi:hypothetical protein
MIRILVAFILTLALSACTALRVYTDFNPAAQFASYRTYSWSATPEQVSPLLAQRIVDNIDMQLRAKGWNKVATGGDVAVAANVATRQEYYVNDYYGGPYWGGWGWGWGGWGGGWGWGGAYGGFSSAHVHSYTVGTLAVDMFDSRTHQAIWRGTAEGAIKQNPTKATADIQTAVAEMFATFPPGSVPAP